MRSGTLSLITPSYGADLDRCIMLAESVDRHVRGFEKHYIIVHDEDVPLFSVLASGRRVVLPTSTFLPSWLRVLPRALQWRKRLYWWSLRSLPVHGWHIQQIVKIAAAATLPDDRYMMLDSDVCFFRDADVAHFGRVTPLPLFTDPLAIEARSPLHARWIDCGHRLLGLAAPRFPADDHIGHLIVWDKTTVSAMTARIEATSGRSWVEALCRTRSFAEYLLYGLFARSDPVAKALHEITVVNACLDDWSGARLDTDRMQRLLSGARSDAIAFCVQSFSSTPVATIRSSLAAFAEGRAPG